MKLALFALLMVCLVAVARSAGEADYDYEEEAPAPAKPAAKPAAKLGGLLSPRSRGTGPLAGRKSPAAAAQTTPSAKTTSTTTEQPNNQEELEYDEEGVEEGAKQEAATTTTTTESPKKIGRGVVRPFRSNEDLLAALKRRRSQGVTSSHPREPSTTQATAEATPSKSKSSQASGRAKSGNTNEVPKSTSRVRFGAARSNKAAPAQEEAQETRTEDVQVKPKAFRRG